MITVIDGEVVQLIPAADLPGLNGMAVIAWLPWDRTDRARRT